MQISEVLVWVAAVTFFTCLIAVLGALAERYESRRHQRTSPPQPADPIPADYSARMDQLTQAVEAIAIEVERLGEGQRFVTKVLAERDRVPAINAPRS